jgi:hypothetical protein
MDAYATWYLETVSRLKCQANIAGLAVANVMEPHYYHSDAE